MVVLKILAHSAH